MTLQLEQFTVAGPKRDKYIMLMAINYQPIITAIYCDNSKEETLLKYGKHGLINVHI